MYQFHPYDSPVCKKAEQAGGVRVTMQGVVCTAHGRIMILPVLLGAYADDAHTWLETPNFIIALVALLGFQWGYNPVSLENQYVLDGVVYTGINGVLPYYSRHTHSAVCFGICSAEFAVFF